MTTELKSLGPLFFHALRDLYSAEKQAVSVLPEMAAAVSSPDLKRGFLEHLEETKGQIGRIEAIFSETGEDLDGKLCLGMQGILKEVQEFIQTKEIRSEVLDAGLLAAAQKIEHYEIAAYGTARSYAHMLGLDQAAQLLEQSLDEEARTNEKLTALAEAHINHEAVSQSETLSESSE